MIAAGRLRPAVAWAPLARPRRLPRAPVVLVAVLVPALAVAVLRAPALDAPLWMDEGISIGIAAHAFGDIPALLRQDGSPPLYYLVLHVWMAVFGSSPTATHALSLAFLALAVPAAGWAAWRPFGPTAGVVAAALVAFNPFAAYYAGDTRMYTLVLLLAVLATGSFVRAFVLRRRAHVGAFAVLLAALLYTHNWALFYAAATGAALIALVALGPDRRGVLRDSALAFAGAAALYAPWVPTLAFQAAHTGAPWSTAPSASELLRALSDMWAGTLPATAVLAGGVLAIARRGTSAQRRAALAVLAIAACTLVLAVAWSHLAAPAWASRYLIVVVAPLAVAAGAGLARAGVLGAAAVVVVLALSWHGRPSPAELAHKSNVADVARAMAPRLPAGSLVVTTQPEQVPTLRYYLGARVRYVTQFGVVRDPRVMDWRDALARLRAARFASVMEPLLQSLPAGAKVLFVGPRYASERTAWSRRIVRDTQRWRHALRRRLHVVAIATPTERSGMSTLAATLFTPAADAAPDTGRESARAPARRARPTRAAAR